VAPALIIIAIVTNRITFFISSDILVC